MIARGAAEPAGAASKATTTATASSARSTAVAATSTSTAAAGPAIVRGAASSADFRSEPNCFCEPQVQGELRRSGQIIDRNGSVGRRWNDVVARLQHRHANSRWIWRQRGPDQLNSKSPLRSLPTVMLYGDPELKIMNGLRRKPRGRQPNHRKTRDRGSRTWRARNPPQDCAGPRESPPSPKRHYWRS